MAFFEHESSCWYTCSFLNSLVYMRTVGTFPFWTSFFQAFQAISYPYCHPFPWATPDNTFAFKCFWQKPPRKPWECSNSGEIKSGPYTRQPLVRLKQTITIFGKERKWSRSVSSDSAALWTVAHQDPPSMEFSRQEYWGGLPFPSPGDLPDTGIKPGSPILQADALPSGATRETHNVWEQGVYCSFWQYQPEPRVQDVILHCRHWPGEWRVGRQVIESTRALLLQCSHFFLH